VANVFRVRSFLHFLSHCVAIAFFLIFFPLIGLNATPGYAESGAVKDEPLSGYPVLQKRTTNPADQLLIIDHPLATPLLVQSEYPMLDQDAFGGDEKTEEKSETVEPITRWVPIWGEQVREKGYDLPLPFGVGANLVFMDQGIDIRNLNVNISVPGLDISSVTFRNSRAEDTAYTARLDMWLLPFVNIYGIFGYINGEARLNINVPAISIGNTPITDSINASLNVDYHGTTYGGGMTLGGGYKNFFATVDGNYTYSNIDVANSKIEVYTISPRLGMLVDSNAIEGSMALWVGAMYMNYRQTVTDSINLNTLIPGFPAVELDFDIDIKNEQPWNFLFGGQWEITKRWQFMAEGGIGNRKHVITGLFFRF
jgi:hypothetical protein